MVERDGQEIPTRISLLEFQERIEHLDGRSRPQTPRDEVGSPGPVSLLGRPGPRPYQRTFSPRSRRRIRPPRKKTLFMMRRMILGSRVAARASWATFLRFPRA